MVLVSNFVAMQTSRCPPRETRMLQNGYPEKTREEERTVLEPHESWLQRQQELQYQLQQKQQQEQQQQEQRNSSQDKMHQRSRDNGISKHSLYNDAALSLRRASLEQNSKTGSIPGILRSQTFYTEDDGCRTLPARHSDSQSRIRRKGRIENGLVPQATHNNHYLNTTASQHLHHSLRHSYSGHQQMANHASTSHSIYITQPESGQENGLPTHYRSMTLPHFHDRSTHSTQDDFRRSDNFRDFSRSGGHLFTTTTSKGTIKLSNGLSRGQSLPINEDPSATPRPKSLSRGKSFPVQNTPSNGPSTVPFPDATDSRVANRVESSPQPKSADDQEIDDSPYAKMTALDTWSPNYVKLSFFMGIKGEKKPNLGTDIAPPSPNTSSRMPVRSKTIGHFQNLPEGSKSFDESGRREMANSKHSNDYANDNEDNGDTYVTMRAVSKYAGLSGDPEVCIPGEFNDKAVRSSRRSDIGHQVPMMTRDEDRFSIRSDIVGHARPGRYSSDAPGNDMNNSPVVQSIYGTMPRRYHDHVLRRTLSHDPRVLKEEDVNPVARASSEGEIESEYVTLDRRYQPSLTGSKLDRVAEVTVVVTPNQSSNGLKVQNPSVVLTNDNDLTNHKNNNSNFGMSSTSNTKHLPNQIHNHVSTSDRYVTSSQNSNLLSPTSNLVTASRSMQSLPTTNASLLEQKRSSLKKKNSTGTLRTVAETIGSVFAPLKTGSSRGSGSPRSVGSLRDTSTFDAEMISANRGGSTRRPSNPQQQTLALKRSKSLPDLQQGDATDAPGNCENFSDDEDGDDFGFLSYPIPFWSSSCSSSSSSAMQKAAKSSPGSRILPKRWRPKSKTASSGSSTSTAAMWTPGPLGSCTWCSVSGRKVHLRPVSVLHLSEAERVALQKIALSKLQNMDLGCPIAIPKECSDQRRAKKAALSLKRRSKSVSASALDALGKDGSGLVFGIPLDKCVVNDKELEKKRKRERAVSTRMTTDIVTEAARPARKSSSSSQEDNLDSTTSNHSSSAHNGTLNPGQNDHIGVPSYKRAASSDSLSESESSRNTSSSLIDALSLSTSNPTSRMSASDGQCWTTHTDVHVPYVVKACFRHLETYGLQTLGIFRVGSSKKRVKQLREEFDSGRDVVLTEDHHPHDVGALLKEYFRDLPEPLLSRELYLPFLHAKRLKDEHKSQMAIRLLISMLPLANRDTLWALLRFLATVSQHATDRTDERGELISGNKMDAHNLATLFGPNILHQSKGNTDKELMAESAARVEQSKEVIEVVKDMIDYHHDLFEISGSLRDDILRLLIESDQETADKILKCLANQSQIEADPESMCSVFEDSMNSPLLHHSIPSDGDLLAVSRRQTSTAHRPLRVTKSADDTLDSPVSKSRATHMSESQALSPSSKDNQRMVSGSNLASQKPTFDLGHSFPSPVPRRVPTLKVSPDGLNPDVVLRGRLETSGMERPCSEGFNQTLHIPRPLYLRENSSSSVGSSSGLSSSLNSHGGSENSQAGQWVLPTPPASRDSSPKPFFRSASSSSTLIATSSSSPNRLSNSNSQDDNFENTPPYGSAEWERERWRHWEQIAAKKKNSETEQETLV